MAAVLHDGLDERETVERQIRSFQVVGEQMGDAEDRPGFARRAEGLDGLVGATEHAGDELVDCQRLTPLEQLSRDLRAVRGGGSVSDGHVRLLWVVAVGFRRRRAAPWP